jgi:hypothetical protein
VTVLASVVVLDEKEINQLFKGYHASSVAEAEKDKIVRASLHHGLARFRETFEATRQELLQSIPSPQDTVTTRNESKFNPEQKELLRQVQCLHAADFAITEGDHVALKVVAFAPCDIDALPKPAVLSEKQERLQYVRIC